MIFFVWKVNSIKIDQVKVWEGDLLDNFIWIKGEEPFWGVWVFFINSLKLGLTSIGAKEKKTVWLEHSLNILQNEGQLRLGDMQ